MPSTLSCRAQGRWRGGAVRLAGYNKVLGIAEGIETALAAAALFELPCWAALSDSGLSSWTAPDEVSEVIIFGDNDENCAGQAAAYALAHRLAVKTRIVHVKLPPDSGRDWNDELWLNRKTAIPEGVQRCS